MAKQTVLTSEGREKLKAELLTLTTVNRKDIAERLKVARGYGDLSENSEYDEAKNEQAKIEARIMELEATLANAKVLDRSEMSSDIVGLGSRVRILDMEYKEEMDVLIVSSSEADPQNNRISDDSPIGSALMGKKKGDTAEANAPGGIMKFKILNIDIYED